MARKCAFLDIDATAFKKLILSNVGSEEGGARQSGFPNAADKEDLYAKVRAIVQENQFLKKLKAIEKHNNEDIC